MNKEEVDKKVIDSFEKFIVDRMRLLTRSEYAEMIDTTIAAYIVNTIKQFYKDYENHKVWLGQDEAVAASFTDIESFIDVVDAYLPGFNRLESSSILNWLVELKAEIEREINPPVSSPDPVPVIISQPNKIPENEKIPKEEKSKKKNAKANQDEAPSDDVVQLQEMFPQFTVKEINKIYRKLSCNYNAAIDELVVLGI